MPISEFYTLADDHYETIALDRETLQFHWQRVTGRSRHSTRHKRCYRIRLERGREIDITEDHSVFTIDPDTARLVTIRGADIAKGTPIVVPFDLSGVAEAWSDDLRCVDLSPVPEARRQKFTRRTLFVEDGYVTNPLRRVQLPVEFPITDDLLYIIGLWLAEGGKEMDSQASALALSIGGIPGAAETLRSYFERFNATVRKSAANDDDYFVQSSVFTAVFKFLGLFGTAKKGEKKFPWLFWDLSQRQRRVMIAGLWDGDGCQASSGEALLTQKSHALIFGVRDCLLLDGILPIVKDGPHSQKMLTITRAQDFRTFLALYPMRHPVKRGTYETLAGVVGRDKATGIWKCPGVWSAVASATLPPGEKTRIYNEGGKYDVSFRSRRSAFATVPAPALLVSSRLAFLRVVDIQETHADVMYDLSVEDAENFVANGILAHNSGYPDCRPEYIDAFERMANLATKAGVEGKSRFHIHRPLVRLGKAAIVRRGAELGVDYGLTWSCYDPRADGRPCGACDSCILRAKGFAEAGARDPLI